ncbi:MAG: hypothetical protein Q9220_001202 [cf. Caloplaca sp. 1 TL-2023]
MRVFLVLSWLALLAQASDSPNLVPRQQPSLSFNGSTLTSPPALSSADAAIIAAAIPPSIIPALAIVIQSAAASASISGDINSLVSSILTAETPPPFLASLPSQYATRLSALEAQLSGIRSQASQATVIPTISVVGNRTLFGNVTAATTVTSNGVTVTTSFTGSVFNGSTTVVGGGLTVMGTSTSAMGGSSTAGGAAASPTGSKGAAATKVPFVAAAVGVVGLLGAAVVL